MIESSIHARTQEIIAVGRQEQHPLANKKTEVWESASNVQTLFEQRFLPTIIQHPETVKQVILLGESGSGKGIHASQAAIDLVRNNELAGNLEAQGLQLKIHYTATVKMVREAIARGMIDGSRWPHYSNEDLSRVTAMANATLAAAEARLPYEDPGHAHVVFEEFVGVSHPVDIGSSIVARQGRSKDSFVIFVVTDPQTQQRAYRQRQGLWDTEKDKQKVLQKSRTTVDMDPSEVVLTMGSHQAIAHYGKIQNEVMYNAFAAQKFDLPDSAERDQERLLALSADELKAFFNNLTSYSVADMETHQLRPDILEGYYRYLADDVWGLSNYVIVRPEFMKNQKIHYYPNYLKDRVVSFDTYLGKTPEWLAPQADIFVSETIL
jgi:hypothetical protein